MTASYFKVLNTAGIVQISDDYHNLAFIQKSIVTTTTSIFTNGSTVTVSGGTFTYTGTTPIIAIRSSALATITGASKSGSTWTYSFAIAGPIGSTATIYIFDEPQALSGNEYGLIVKNASNKIVYDSNQKYMKLVDFQYLTMPNSGTIGVGGLPTPPSYTYTGNSSKVYAAVFARPGGYTITYPGGPGVPSQTQSFVLGAKYTSSGIEFDMMSFGVIPSYNYGNSAIMVIDVTNY